MLKQRIVMYIIGLGILINGCGQYKSINETNKIVIRFALVGDITEIQTYTKLINIFQLEHPDIKIKMEHIPGGYESRILTQSAGGISPDVFWLMDPMVAPFGMRGIAEDIWPYVNQSEEMEDFYPLALEGGSFDGHLYSLPNQLAPVVLFYNKDLFDKEGITYPDDNWSWDTLLEGGRKLTKEDNNGNIIQYGFVNQLSYDGFSVFILQNGGQVFNKDMTECLIDSPESIEAIQFLSDLRNRYKISPSLSGERQIGRISIFTMGKGAMTLDGHWMVPAYAKECKFRWDVASLFKNKMKVVFAVSSGFAISTQSKHKEDAWEWVKFIASHKGQIEGAKTGMISPSRKSVANSEYFLDPNSLPENDRIFIEVLEYAKLMPHHPKFSIIQDKALSGLEQVWLGEKAIDICPQIKKKVNIMLSEE